MSKRKIKETDLNEFIVNCINETVQTIESPENQICMFQLFRSCKKDYCRYKHVSFEERQKYVAEKYRLYTNKEYNTLYDFYDEKKEKINEMKRKEMINDRETKLLLELKEIEISKLIQKIKEKDSEIKELKRRRSIHLSSK